MHYPRLQQQWKLTEEEIQVFIAELDLVAEVVELPALADEESVSTDPDDNPVIQTAVQGKADILCTRDKHIRTQRVRAYCLKLGIQVMTEIELLRLLREGKKE